MGVSQIDLILSLLQQMCVYLVIAYLLSKTPLFIPLMQVTIRLPHKLVCYLTFSMFCIMGTYFGLHIDDSIANTRAIGAVLGGVLGGPSVGFLVGLTGGLHRYSMGGMTAMACMISTVVEGLVGGLLHRYMLKNNRLDLLFQPLVIAAITFLAECLQMLIILIVARPFWEAEELVENIALRCDVYADLARSAGDLRKIYVGIFLQSATNCSASRGGNAAGIQSKKQYESCARAL